MDVFPKKNIERFSMQFPKKFEWKAAEEVFEDIPIKIDRNFLNRI